ncbi:Protein of unknown function [Cotesia congregata]|uniref:Tyr recombinase domain-containing protein n=1 Tax=Cotesia congregata TaxID=51543 RepID=A0A8J2HIP1_COTCN|nr:Protein of unknown function [Cotesia congregata]
MSYQPKKVGVLTLSQVKDFLNQADDLTNLANKVILIFGVFGALRPHEISIINVQNVKDTGNQFTVTINDSKNCFLRNFTIDQEYYGIIHKYISLRSKDFDDQHFFVTYNMGQCKSQVIGKRKIAEVPKIVPKSRRKS